MSDQWQLTECRLLELLADRSTFGLTRGEETELRQLMTTVPHFDIECMERAAATAQLAFASVEPMPSAFREKIRASGVWHVSAEPRERT